MKRESAFAFMAIASQLGLQAQNKAETKPNIIFIFADDMGWGDLSCYGNNIQTPNLDRLATRGILFTNFYVAASVSSPSRAGILTGQYPARNLIFDYISNTKLNQERGMPDNLNPDLTTLADLLQADGYVTGHFGKWHLGTTITSGEYGFTEFRTNNGYSNIQNKEPFRFPVEKRPMSTHDILNETLEFIKRNKDNPFYVNAWFIDVHAVLNPNQEQLDSLSNMQHPGIRFNNIRHVYYAALLEMDRQIGMFLKSIEELGLDKNTIIIFSADNGPEDLHLREAGHSGAGSPGPFRGRKRSIYDGGMRTPFIVSWPGHIPEAVVNDYSIVGGVDFIPTLCSLTGTKVPKDMKLDGEDMSKAILGDLNYQRKNPLFWEWRANVFGHLYNVPPRLAMRDGEWKFLMNPDGSRKELYNIVNDPMEIDNLADQNPGLVDSYSGTLLEWYKTLPPETWVHRVSANNKYPWPTTEKLKSMKKD